MYIFAGIDGTGPLSDQVYERRFEDSFVRRMSVNFRWLHNIYLRGPSADGVRTGSRARDVYGQISAVRRASGASPIVLAGYSRGGAAAIEACRLLQMNDVAVDHLFLFDAVDRTPLPALNVGVIPGNVKFCYHALRHPASRSRTSWGNCGRSIERGSATKLFRRQFMCTHGAMGGLPWRESGPRGFINEAHTPSNREIMRDAVSSPDWRTRAKSGMIAATGATPAGRLAAAVNLAHHAASDTAITVDQDAEGSRQVGEWMWQFLNALPVKLPPVLQRMWNVA